MCGLFGWSLKSDVSTNSIKRAYRVLSSNNDARGGHSFGAFIVDHGKIVRGLGKMAQAKWTPGHAPVNSKRVLCHTRYATHGTINVSNAHPFKVGTIIGAHNGIIYNHEELNKRYERKFQVDSQHIFAHIAEARELDDLEGYGAITYVDTNDPECIWLGRFCSGELAVARLTDGRGIVWSSDDDHLKDACKAAGWTFEFMRIDESELYVVEGTEIYTTTKRIEVKRGLKLINWQDVLMTSTDEEEKYWDRFRFGQESDDNGDSEFDESEFNFYYGGEKV